MKTISGTFLIRFLLLSLFFFPLSGICQKTVEVLVLTNTQKDKVFTIKSAKRVKIWYDGDLIIKGKIQDVKNDSILVNNQLIGLNQINKIRINKTGVKIVGGAISFSGLIITGMGIAVLASAKSASGCLGPAAATIAGIAITGTGAVIVLVGLPLILIGKKFDISKGWQISTALAVD